MHFPLSLFLVPFQWKDIAIEKKISDNQYLAQVNDEPVILRCGNPLGLNWEARLLDRYPSPYFTTLKGTVQDEDGSCLLIQKYDMDMWKYSVSMPRATNKQWHKIRLLSLEMTKAVDAVHARGLIHNSLQLSHFYIDKKELNVVLGHFDKTVPQSEDYPQHSLWGHSSPEETVSIESDVYSFGISLFRFLTGRYPITHHRPHLLITRIPIEDIGTLPSVSVPSATLIPLFKDLLSDDPSKRNLTAILEHPWFSQ